MKLIAIIFALALATARVVAAEPPSLSVYQVIPDDSKPGKGELILKLNNPPGRTYYVWGFGITGAIHHIEVQRRGKWVLAPGQGGCATSADFYPLLPDSYVVFDTFLPRSVKNYSTFRVTLRLLTNPDPMNPGPEPAKPGYIDLVSEPFSTKDLKPVKHPEESPSQ